jgi:hypothetical protein
MEQLEGKREILRHDLVNAIRKDIPIQSEHKQLETYRQGLAVSFIQKLLVALGRDLEKTDIKEVKTKRTSTQSYQKANADQPDYDEVERPVAHVCSAEQG